MIVFKMAKSLSSNILHTAKSEITCFTILSTDSNIMAFATVDGGVSFLNINTNKLIMNNAVNHSKPVSCLCSID